MLRFLCLPLFALLCLIYQVRSGESQTPTSNLYNLTSGVYLANEIKIANKSLHKLLGVPYADIPMPFEKSTSYLNKLDSANAKKADVWPSLCVNPVIFHNSFYGNFKIPHEYEMSLNCLTISLYIPLGLNKTREKNLTAMFFIHGGSNAAGASSFIDGSALASVGNVIVAMPNYRLDVLGFLNKKNFAKNTSSLKGNYGLWDQVLALEWLYNNCQELGCDKNSITVFGHSAGSGDTMLLALSRHAQPYIKRIVMQSGSGLAHWSFLYEYHLIDKLKQAKESKSLNENQLIDLIHKTKFHKSKYFNSLNDTFSNFLTFTTCNRTQKYSCLKEKFYKFSKFLHSSSLNLVDQEELKYVKYTKSLLGSLDLHEMLSLLGYLQEMLQENFNRNMLQSVLFEPDRDFELLVENAHLNETNSAEEFFSQFLKRNNQEKKFDFEALNKTNSNKSSCYPDLALIIPSTDNLILVCDFIRDFNKNYQLLFKSKTLRYFIGCFKIYFNDLREKNNPNDDLLDRILLHKSEFVIDEMKQCLSQATSLNKLIIQKGKSEDSKLSLNDTLKETSFLTENSNYIHRPTVDMDLLTSIPHLDVVDNKFLNNDIDILIGLTSHESFYFLLHDYNINDILVHTFIYSSLINKTENILDKLGEINQNKELNYCLKRSLLGYYNVSLTDKELDKNSLKKKSESLEMISDFDFVLPVVTQLKAYLEYNKNRNADKNMFVYEFSHKASFNYLLDHMKNFYHDYEFALKKLNYTVTPHFGELDFVFGLPILGRSNLITTKNEVNLLYNYTQHEYDFSLMVIEYWTNFAKYGDPNLSDSSRAKWPKFTKQNADIFNIDSNYQRANDKLFSKWLKRHEFWYDELPNKVYDKCYSRFKNPQANYAKQISNSSPTKLLNFCIFIFYFLNVFVFNFVFA